MTQTIQNQTRSETNPYWESFERLDLELKHPAWVFPLRQAAISRFAELGFPTTHDEDWRFTNVAPLARMRFQPVREYSPAGLTAPAIRRYSFADLAGSRLVFVNGHFSAEFSSLPPQTDGVKIGSLATAMETDSGLIEQYLGRHAHGEETAFTALNTAFFQDGAFIHVPAGKTVADPVHLLFISTETGTGAGAHTHPRNLIIAEKESKLTVIESYVGAAGAAYFTNAVDVLVIGENAVVEHCKFQDESLAAFHIAAIYADLGRNCNFIAHSIATGARLSRNDIRTNLAGEESSVF